MFNMRKYHQIMARDGYCNWTRQLPSWHVNLYMTRPARRQTKLLCRKIETGEDPEGVIFPLPHKPTEYYW